jgi:hypothetical protein
MVSSSQIYASLTGIHYAAQPWVGVLSEKRFSDLKYSINRIPLQDTIRQITAL